MDESRKQFAENDNLVDRLNGMASYLADKGAVKAPDLLNEAAREICELRNSIGAIRKLNNGMWRWTSCMSYNESYVGEPGGLLKSSIREIEHILDAEKDRAAGIKVKE